MNYPCLLFYDILQKGLGRAFKYIKQDEGDRDRIRADLLNACLHNLAYDPQCEPGRSEYLFELISLTGDLDFYRAKIFQALTTTEEFWDIHQLYDLVFIWAKQGDREARKIIYQTFKKQENNESWLGGEQIIKLDGIEGLLEVAEIVGKKLLQDRELGEDDWLIKEARESYGVNKINSALERAALSNDEVKAYLDAVKAYEAENAVINKTEKQRQINKYKNLKLDYILQKIAEPRCHFYLLNKFGINASDRDLEIVLNRLLQETKKEQLRRYLWIFKNRQFPRLDSRLFDLAASVDEDIQYCAIAALSNNRSELLRSLAIYLINETKAIANRLLSLFIKNYQSGDFQLIESALIRSQDLEFRHAAGMDLINVINAQKNPELLNCAFWIYENTPCADCRESILKILIDSKQITSEILEECLHDSSFDIRALAKKHLQGFLY